MSLELLHYQDKVTIINPNGNVGVLTLWTPLKTVLSFFERECVDTSTDSPFCAISQFYGDGLPQLLRNLLYNPQITSIIMLGQDLSNSATEFMNFIQEGTEQVNFLGNTCQRIKGTSRIIDSMIDPELLDDLQVFNIGNKLGIPMASIIKNSLMQYRLPRKTDRVTIALPVVEAKSFPSNIHGHVVTRQHPVEAWKELVFRIMRFGVPTDCGKGKKRIELTNVKVIITEPLHFESHFKDIGVNVDEVLHYQMHFLDKTEPVDVNYTYGHRIGAYFGFDAISYVVEMLSVDVSRRDCYVTLWHSFKDMNLHNNDASHPCLVSLFFRVIDSKLNVTATFRVHNCMSAYLKNVYGIMEIQQVVLDRLSPKLGVAAGVITVLSQSITIDPAATDKMLIAESLVKEGYHGYDFDERGKKTSFRSDPQGYFSFTLDKHELVCYHMYQGVKLKEYRGKTAAEIERDLIADQAISLVDHALYVGRELMKLETQRDKVAVDD